MSKENIQENTIIILSNHFGFTYQEGYNIVSSHFFGETNKPLNTFQAFCHALTALETYGLTATMEIAEERWNELSISAQTHWEKVGTYFPSTQIFKDKLKEIQERIANDIEHKYYIINNEQIASDIRCTLSRAILLGLSDFLIWTDEDEDKELPSVYKYIPSTSRPLTREETIEYYAKEDALRKEKDMQEAARIASLGERASGRKAQKRAARQAHKIREINEEAEKSKLN